MRDGTEHDVGLAPDHLGVAHPDAGVSEVLCEPRGAIEVKGKGKLEAWYLVGREAGPAPEGLARPEPIRSPEAVPGA